MSVLQRDPKLALLETLPGLGVCSRRELAVLARLLDEHEVRAGATLAREGGIAHDLYIVVEGTAEVRRDGVVLWEIGPGGLVGELGLLRAAPGATTVTATTAMRVLALSPHGRSTLFQLPSVAMWAWGHLVSRACAVLGAPEAWHLS